MGIPSAVKAVVANYQRRALWLEAADLQQQAALTMIEAARTWKPGGAPLAAYQASAVARNLERYIAAQASPVHETHGRASGARGCDLEAIASLGEPPDAEFHIDLKRACEEVRRILASKSPAARAVLLGERKPADVAAEMGLPARQLYVEIKAATRALRASPVLAMLVLD